MSYFIDAVLKQLPPLNGLDLKIKRFYFTEWSNSSKRHWCQWEYVEIEIDG